MALAQPAEDLVTEVADIPVIEFVEPVIGFGELTRFALVENGGDQTLWNLTALEREGVSFLVVQAGQFYPNLSIEVADETVAALGVTAAEDVVVLLIVKAGHDLNDTTVNIKAPVLLNVVNRKAAQIVLDDPDLSVTAPLIATLAG